MKLCNRCEVQKPLTNFSRKKAGHQPNCKACSSEIHKAWRGQNRDSELSKARSRYAENRDVLLEKQKRYYAENKEARLAYAEQWRTTNPDKIRGEYVQNAVTYRLRAKQWKAKNPDRARVQELARRSHTRRIPAWADRQLMADIYQYARIMRANGVDCHVDHEVPLRGKNVCGLHVHTNLRVIPAKDNLAKGARWD